MSIKTEQHKIGNETQPHATKPEALNSRSGLSARLLSSSRSEFPTESQSASEPRPLNTGISLSAVRELPDGKTIPMRLRITVPDAEGIIKAREAGYNFQYVFVVGKEGSQSRGELRISNQAGDIIDKVQIKKLDGIGAPDVSEYSTIKNSAIGLDKPGVFGARPYQMTLDSTKDKELIESIDKAHKEGRLIRYYTNESRGVTIEIFSKADNKTVASESMNSRRAAVPSERKRVLAELLARE